MKPCNTVKICRDGQMIEAGVFDDDRGTGSVTLAYSAEGRVFQVDVPEEALEMPPIQILSEREIGRLCRYETKRSDYFGDSDNTDIYLEEAHLVTAEDVLTAMRNIAGAADDNDTVTMEWYIPLSRLMFETESPDERIEFELCPSGATIPYSLPPRDDFLYDIFYEHIDNLLVDGKPFSEQTHLISEMVTNYLEDEKKPAHERLHYTEEEMERVIREIQESGLSGVDQEDMLLYRTFTDRLCAMDNVTALRQKGFGCYGGNEAYACDWKMSYACLKRAFELAGSPADANALGYICYYGRCWDGEPQNAEAFYYFSCGAAGGLYESRYKLADMFLKGRGVPANPRTACSIIEELYEQNIKYIMQGNLDCKFADVALRYGELTEMGLFPDLPPEAAFLFYLQADFAIRQRLPYGYYGDTRVAKAISDDLERLRARGAARRLYRYSGFRPDIALHRYLKKYRNLRLQSSPLRDGEMELVISVQPAYGENTMQKIFITDAGTEFCGLLSEVHILVRHAEASFPVGTPRSFLFNMLIPSEENETDRGIGGLFFVQDTAVAARIQGEFSLIPPERRRNRIFRIASVCFEPGGKTYDYMLELENVEPGDTVIVMTSRGETPVTVVAVRERRENELFMPPEQYKQVLRRVQL